MYPVHRNPRTGLLRTFWEPRRVLRSPFRGFCVQGIQNGPSKKAQRATGSMTYAICSAWKFHNFLRIFVGIPTTPDPNTSAKGGVSWYKLVVYILLSAKERAYLCKSIAIEMGGVSRYFSKVSGSGRCSSAEFLWEFLAHCWETDFYSVRVLGGSAFSLWGCQTPAQYWIKIVHPWVQKFYPVLGLGSGGRLLRHFQTPVLHWINCSLRIAQLGSP